MKTRSINKLFKSDVVFFDVFDTLIERTVGSPSEVFRLVGDEQFFDRRVSAERQCAEAGGQFTLADIYRILEKYYGEETKSLMQKEIDAELSCCRAKEDVYSVFGRLVAAGKEIFLISDMYLPSSVIERMLQRCGYSGYKKLYVSNECGCGKRSGKLFRYVIEDNALSGKSIIHVGDSIRGDFLGARKAGIKSVLIGRKNRLKRLLHIK